MQSDPIRLAGGISKYGYVGANPVKFFDLLGLSSCSCEERTREVAGAPDGDKWDQRRTVNSSTEAYRFGRWNATYAPPRTFIKDYFLNSMVASGSATAYTYLATGAKGFSFGAFAVGTMVGMGHAGVQDFSNSQSTRYSDQERRVIDNYNSALTECLRGRGGE